jgi:hypothetical protein
MSHAARSLPSLRSTATDASAASTVAASEAPRFDTARATRIAIPASGSAKAAPHAAGGSSGASCQTNIGSPSTTS